MAQIITNRASLVYQYNGQTVSTESNLATAVIGDPLSISKIALPDTYRAGDILTYAINLSNSSGTPLSGITVTDNLGSYALDTLSVTPLTYVGPALLFLDGSYSGTLTPTLGTDSVSFTLPSLATGAKAQILYRAALNTYAPLTPGATVTNTAAVTADGTTATAQASETVSAETYAEVSINKTMSVVGNEITYRFLIENYGNAQATDILLQDAFSPAPTAITVQINGEVVSTEDYTYQGGVLTLPTGSALSLTLPPATTVQDPVTGEITLTPSSLTVTVIGTL